jgi:glycosyltransferase involved in cell wall biosynthesis
MSAFERCRISLVTPSHDQGDVIERSIVSVLGQRYPRLDYIMMDGASTDATPEVLRRYQRHFTYLDMAADAGMAAALHRGFARATGEILGVMAADAILAPGALDFVAWIFSRNPQLDMLYGHRLELDAAGRVVRYLLLPPHNPAIMRRVELIPPETAFFRRSLYERAGPVDRSVKALVLHDLFVRFMTIGRMRRVDRFLAARRVSGVGAIDAETADVERRRIEAAHKLHSNRLWRFLLWRAVQGSQWRGEAFARYGQHRPGALPGLGYTYDRVWGGTLDSPRDAGL